MTQDKWLAERLAYLRGLKAPSDQQRLLLMLADKPDRTADDAIKSGRLSLLGSVHIIGLQLPNLFEC